MEIHLVQAEFWRATKPVKNQVNSDPCGIDKYIININCILIYKYRVELGK